VTDDKNPRNWPLETALEIKELTDEHLISEAITAHTPPILNLAELGRLSNPAYSIEMDRRLKVAIVNLTREMVKFHESSDRLARLLVWLTIILVIMTAVLIMLAIITLK